jgi:Gpi18-like mannosyltransferase
MNGEQARWYLRSEIWFWCVIAFGAVIRFYLVVFTDGTTDVQIWERHARDVHDYGLIAYYRGDPSANHPPFITEVEMLFYRISKATGIPFRILLRAPFASLDLGTAFLLLLLFDERRGRFVAAAVCWLNPLSIIFSAYHGNTDSAVAFLLILCVWLLSIDRVFSTALAFGVSLWIKLPVVAAIPALFFFIRTWRRRFQWLFIAGTVGIATYIPALIQDPLVIWKNVFGYRPPLTVTTGGIPSWGPFMLCFSIIAPRQNWPAALQTPIQFYFHNSWLIALALAVLIIWLRRSDRRAFELCATIGAVYVIILALCFGFSFQYFAWSVPFWLFLPRWFFVPAIVLASSYIYFLYAYLCGNPWLLGVWDFSGHPQWPFAIIMIRNIAYLFFCTSAIWFVISEFLKLLKRESGADVSV